VTLAAAKVIGFIASIGFAGKDELTIAHPSGSEPNMR